MAGVAEGGCWGSRVGLHLQDGSAGGISPAQSLLPSTSAHMVFTARAWDCIALGVSVLP